MAKKPAAPSFNFGANAKPRTRKAGKKASGKATGKGKRTDAFTAYTGGGRNTNPFE
jgi:hypothetical protein